MMNAYDKAVLQFLWLSAVHFATDLRAVPARPVPVRALPAEHPVRRGGLGGTGSGGSRVEAAADGAAPAARAPQPARSTANAERALAQRGDERLLRAERGNDRRRTAAWPPGVAPNTPPGALRPVARLSPCPVGRRPHRQEFPDVSGQWR